MHKIIAVPAFALACTIATAANAVSTVKAVEPTMPYEEAAALREERLIITSPIAGIENHFWFDYRINVVEAKKELSSDLHHARNIKHVRHAWDEYRSELVHERDHYVKAMAKRGYRQGYVIVGG